LKSEKQGKNSRKNSRRLSASCREIPFTVDAGIKASLMEIKKRWLH